MPSIRSGQSRKLRFIEVVGYVTILAVGVSVLQDLLASSRFSLRAEILIAAFAAFAVLYPLPRRPWARDARSLLVSVGVEMALVIVLFVAAAPNWLPAVLYFVLLPTCTRLPKRIRYAYYAASILATIVAMTVGARVLEHLVSAIALLPAFAAVIAFTESSRAMRESAEEMRKVMDGLIEAQGRVRELTVVEERQRLAQEMHDAVGHRLSVAAVQLEAVTRLIDTDPHKAAALAATSREQVREGLKELRAAVGSLRAPVELAAPLARSIADAAAVFTQGCNVAVTTDIDPAIDSLDPDRATVVLRCVQEGLTNVHRHAYAESARISVAIRPGASGSSEVVVELTDDGCGAAARGDTDRAKTPASGGFGLQSLRSRAEAFGGRLEFAGGPDGARLSLFIPVGRG